MPHAGIRRILLVAAVFALLLAPRAMSQSASGSSVIAITGGMLVDGNGGPPVHDAVVVIRDERIAAAGPRGTVAIPNGAKIINAGGMTVMPGLWDLHVHLMIMGHGKYDEYFPRYRTRMREIIPVSAKELLMHGVTSARDMGAPLEEIIEVRDRINRGEVPGPRLFVSGPFLQKSFAESDSYFRWAVKGADDARGKTRRLIDAKVDFIKVIQGAELSEEEFGAIVEEAHKARLTVATHGKEEDEIRKVVRLGADTIEHTGYTAGALPYSQDILRLLIDRQTWVVPTCTVHWLSGVLRDFPERRLDQEVAADYPADVVKDMQESLANVSGLRYWQRSPGYIDGAPQRWRQMIQARLRIAVGTDSGTPANFHIDSTWREVQILVQHGMTPLEAIRAATKYPAMVLRKGNDLGTIEPGKLADIILVKGSVIEDVGNLKNVTTVIKGGKIVR